LKKIFVIKTKYRNFRIVIEDGFLLSIDTISENETPSEFLDETAKTVLGQLEEYFSKNRENFDIPFKMKGTSFQQDVWKALLQIPYGKTASYSLVAEMSGHKRAVRAVGTALKNNPLPIVIPCHRIIRKNGLVGNYNGGTDMKKYLLELEKSGS